jgi:hypothetical protein
MTTGLAPNRGEVSSRKPFRFTRTATLPFWLAFTSFFLAGQLGRADESALERAIDQTYTTSTLSGIVRVDGSPLTFELRQTISYRFEQKPPPAAPDAERLRIVAQNYSFEFRDRFRCEALEHEEEQHEKLPLPEVLVLDQVIRPNRRSDESSGPWHTARAWLTVNTQNFDPMRDVALLVSLEPLKLAIATRWEGPVVRGRPEADSHAVRNLCRAGAEFLPGGLFDSLQLVFEERLDVTAWATVTFDDDGVGRLELIRTTVRELVCGGGKAE